MPNPTSRSQKTGSRNSRSQNPGSLNSRSLSPGRNSRLMPGSQISRNQNSRSRTQKSLTRRNRTRRSRDSRRRLPRSTRLALRVDMPSRARTSPAKYSNASPVWMASRGPPRLRPKERSRPGYAPSPKASGWTRTRASAASRAISPRHPDFRDGVRQVLTYDWSIPGATSRSHRSLRQS